MDEHAVRDRLLKTIDDITPPPLSGENADSILLASEPPRQVQHSVTTPRLGSVSYYNHKSNQLYFPHLDEGYHSVTTSGSRHSAGPSVRSTLTDSTDNSMSNASLESSTRSRHFSNYYSASRFPSPLYGEGLYIVEHAGLAFGNSEQGRREAHYPPQPDLSINRTQPPEYASRGTHSKTEDYSARDVNLYTSPMAHTRTEDHSERDSNLYASHWACTRAEDYLGRDRNRYELSGAYTRTQDSSVHDGNLYPFRGPQMTTEDRSAHDWHTFHATTTTQESYMNPSDSAVQSAAHCLLQVKNASFHSLAPVVDVKGPRKKPGVLAREVPESDQRDLVPDGQPRYRMFPTIGADPHQSQSNVLLRKMQEAPRSYTELSDSRKGSNNDTGTPVDATDLDDEKCRILTVSLKSLLLLFSGKVRGYTGGYNNKASQGLLSEAGRTSSARSRTDARKCGASQQDDEEQDEEGGRPNKRPRMVPKANKITEQKLLACPFHKYDSFLFGPDSPEPCYHVCGTAKFVHVAHLKQHLQRNHVVPRIYCYRCCSTDFTSNGELKMHLRAQPACEPRDPPLFIERIDQDLSDALNLNRKNDCGVGREEYWFEVFDTLFPSVRPSRVITPFYEGPGREYLNMFLVFSRSHVRHVVRDAVRADQLQNTESSSTSGVLTLDENTVLQEAVRHFDASLTQRQWPRLTQPQGADISQILYANEPRHSQSSAQDENEMARNDQAEPTIAPSVLTSQPTDIATGVSSTQSLPETIPTPSWHTSQPDYADKYFQHNSDDFLGVNDEFTGLLEELAKSGEDSYIPFLSEPFADADLKIVVDEVRQMATDTAQCQVEHGSFC